MSVIPIADLAEIKDVLDPQNDPDWKRAACQIRAGLGSTGFLYVVNHGIPEDSKDSFDFNEYVGYTPPGGEKLHPNAKFELKETYDWLSYACKGPISEAPKFLPNIGELDKECKIFLKKFLRLLAMSLDLQDIDFFVAKCQHFDNPAEYRGLYNIRLLHYPPISPGEVFPPEGAVRCGKHSDYGFITLLFQDEVGGLEVKTVDGKWTEAVPIQGSVLINTGDLIEFWTKGGFTATAHRIVVPEAERRAKSRFSVAFFNGPDADCIVTPMDIVKTSGETERLGASSGKIYEDQAIQAEKYMLNRVAQQYIYFFINAQYFIQWL